MNTINIGERIKLARKAAGVSLRELAEQAGVSAMAISKYERGLDVPGSAVLVRLSKALGVRTEFFLRATPPFDIQPVYRSRASHSLKDQDTVKAQIQEWLERYLTVESLFPNEQMPRFSYPAGFPRQVSSFDEVERAAEDLRQLWGLCDAPIENLTELLEDHGIKVGLVDGNVKFDACAFHSDHSGPVIALKRSAPGDRRRFSLTHELGHLMLESVEGLDEEKACNRFAAAFLVPAGAARYELGENRHHLDPVELLSLKAKYGLSMAAWVYRAKDLGILTNDNTDNLWRQFSQYGWRKNEPGPLPPEEPQRLVRLVRRLLAEDEISEARGAELLGISLGVYLKQRAAIYGEAGADLRR